MRLSSLRAGLCWLSPSTLRRGRGEGGGKKNHNGVGVRQKAGERYIIKSFNQLQLVDFAVIDARDTGHVLYREHVEIEQFKATSSRSVKPLDRRTLARRL